MNPGSVILSANTEHVGRPDGQRTLDPCVAAGLGLWVFMAVAGMLFSLFLVAYVMRMQSTDWSSMALPWPLWLSTALLVAASLAMQSASTAAHTGRSVQARRWLLAGGLCALMFLGVQLWAWQLLQDARVAMAGNPAASFFYVLTALHGLHVLGGLVGWGITLRAVRLSGDTTRQAWRIALCARYWHFLLGVWLVLFAALGWLTPALVAFICGTA
ncbi:cytochrome c oxidase subunit 3 [Polaromonas sp. SM01]|uniref:cytochrome c oxidase subunit 3 n=1 Tax=Polaromonas sp. SM01 TaxID=3085630 RepID=UPI0029810514|nr:cytochrome c oxidase subunit 3 [Polaromonas sp. SM01]MDW5442122.1 cytochrome c oxidase subunit 3 [Polaromonas sp. SM01]